MKKWLVWLVLGLYLAIGASAWAQPQIPPTPTASIYVQDYAGVLSGDTKAKINNLGYNLDKKTKAQIVVVTVKSLEGTSADEYALATLRKWGIGDKTLNNGVLILVSTGDRKSRIEVGYGLEGALPDAKTGRIQDEYMIPYFKQGDYDKGILNGYLAVVNEAAKEYKVEIKTDTKSTRRVQSASGETWWDTLPWWAKIMLAGGLLFLFIIDWVFFGGAITFLLLSILRFRGGGGGGGSGGGGFGGGSGGGGGSDRSW